MLAVQAAIALPVVIFLLVAPPVGLDNMHGPDTDELMDEAIAQEEAEEDAGGAPHLESLSSSSKFRF